MASAQPGSFRAERRAQELSLRRADVIVAASFVFAQKGFQGAQMSEIAAFAELSTKSVYALFLSKEALYEEVIRSAAEAVRAKVQQLIDAIEDPREQLLTLIDSLFSCFDEHGALLQLYAKSTHGLPWKVRQSLGEPSLHVFQDFTNWVITIANKATNWVITIANKAKQKGHLSDLEPEAVAVSIVGSVITAAAHWVEGESQKPVSAAAPAVRAIFEHVLARGRKRR